MMVFESSVIILIIHVSSAFFVPDFEVRFFSLRYLTFFRIAIHTSLYLAHAEIPHPPHGQPAPGPKHHYLGDLY